LRPQASHSVAIDKRLHHDTGGQEGEKMELVFLRHGDAEDVGPDGSDFGRRLTPRGEAETERVARLLLEAGVLPQRIITSPLVRAQETAAIIARAAGPDAEVQADDRLKSGAGLQQIEAIVADSPLERLLLVGHEPDFSQTVGALIGGGRIEMKKSGAACVSLNAVQRGAGELRWLVRADLLRRD
jgi:phosphohistidine phosphatase